ncbi:hypothetical protein Bca4012_048937 [Brassica carinata]|uniref:Uncharacterized protein n=1 Tax=Brassica carinata TaxID=52824 RepID=A0A8X7R3G6_BRACI|nr:hypothetical protein Bca52824_051763 [Brassica carinata]
MSHGDIEGDGHVRVGSLVILEGLSSLELFLLVKPDNIPPRRLWKPSMLGASLNPNVKVTVQQLYA